MESGFFVFPCSSHVQASMITSATISYQSLMRLYTKVGGMTGTAKTEVSTPPAPQSPFCIRRTALLYCIALDCTLF